MSHVGEVVQPGATYVDNEGAGARIVECADKATMCSVPLAWLGSGRHNSCLAGRTGDSPGKACSRVIQHRLANDSSLCSRSNSHRR
jgi:hypothetical protein